MKKLLLSLLCLMALVVANAATIGDKYSKVTSTSDLSIDAEYILCYDTNAMGAQSGKFRLRVANGVSLEGDVATIESVDVAQFTIVNGTEAGTYAFEFGNGSFLQCTSTSNNNLGEVTKLAENCNLKITIANGIATIIPTKNSNSDKNKIQYNKNSGQERFSNYKTGTQQNCTLYKKVADEPVDPDATAKPVITFDELTNKVSITCETEGASIYYTLDDAEPTAESTLYGEPFEVTKSCTVKAIAIKDGKQSSVATLPVTIVAKANSISELLSLAPNKDDQAFVACTLTVVYASGKYVYVVDAEGGSTLLFENATTKFVAGDVIPGGWVATANPYNGLPEYNGEFPAATAKAEFTIPTVESVSEADINRVVVLKNVTFAAATPADNSSNIDGTVNGATLQFRNNFAIASVPAGVYDVKLAVGTFKGTLQAYPIEYTKVVSTEVKPFVTDPEAVNETITVAKGAVVKFTAAGAAKIDYTVDDGSETKTGTAEGEVFELTATEACTVELKAYDVNGEVKQTATYMVDLEAAPLCGEITFDPAAGEIAKGTVVTVKAENAVKYEYMIEVGENLSDPVNVEVPEFTVTISENCTLHVIAYNADDKSVEGSAAYTVVEGPASSSVDIVFACQQSTGAQIKKANMTDINYMIHSKSQSLVASLSGASNLCGGVSNSVRFGTYSNGSYKQGALTITLKEAYKITSIDVTITTYKSTNKEAPKNPTWNLNINGHQMVETLSEDVNETTTYNIPFETVALADESAAKTLTIKSTDAPVDVYSLKINYEPTSTGVNDIIADDANAPVEYYNLQGVRVANPESGLYIRVQGKKATKVLVK